MCQHLPAPKSARRCYGGLTAGFGRGVHSEAVWHASGGVSLVICSGDGRERGYSMDGASRGEVPLLGDYDGDRKADLAVWRVADSAWHIKLSSERDEQRRKLDPEFIRPARKPGLARKLGR